MRKELKLINRNSDSDYDSQCVIFKEHYKNQLRYRNMITDCCSIDVFVYATYDYLQGKYNLIEYLEHERLILLSLGDYDKFFIFP